MIRILLTLIIALAVSTPVGAQVFDFDKDRVKVLELDGQWRFHTGDDLRWAEPAFDDSGWTLLKSELPWTAQGFRGYGGMAWYRFTVLMPEKHKELALLVINLTTAYQVYVNGKLIAGVGNMPPRARPLDPVLHVHPIPLDAIGTGRSLSVAIRVWHAQSWAPYYGGGPGDATLIGETDRIDEYKLLVTLWHFWDLSAPNVLLIINLLSSVAGLAWFWSRKTDTEYLWFGLYGLMNAAELIREDYCTFYETNFIATNVLGDALKVAGPFFFLLFTLSVLKERRNWTFWSCAIILLAAPCIIPFSSTFGWISVPVMWMLWCAALFPARTLVLILLIRGVRRGSRDARLIIGPVAIEMIDESLMLVMRAIASTGRAGYSVGDLFWFRPLTTWPFPVYPENVVSLLMLLSVLAILLGRFIRARRDEARMTSELESAGTVQKVLIPTAMPEVPGFTLDSVYRPALQVGGDFFQIMSTRPGGVLAVIGDVSGKGMPAAMTVSLLVGTLRTLAHYTDAPGEILSAMNTRMLRRSEGGFTTCLVLRIDSDGCATIANAGHIAPYLNGQELELQNGLPLGLAAETAYPETASSLNVNDQLTLVTDGVVEAQNRSGELYGFSRTAAIATRKAEEIASAAQTFGQEDDITVVTIRRLEIRDHAIPVESVSTIVVPQLD